MSNPEPVVNIVFAGLGGMGVLKASDICAQCAFLADYDVKKSEIHGMSQRGGSVTSDVRYGLKVYSPMVPAGEADFLVALDETQVAPNQHVVRDGGVIVTPSRLEVVYGPMAELSEQALPLTQRNFNVAILGMLSLYLKFSDGEWDAALRACLPEHTFEQNKAVFQLGRRFGAGATPSPHDATGENRR